MDETNHNMVHTITQHIGNVFTPLLENTTRSYQQLNYQMGRIANLFGARPVPPTPMPNISQGVNPSENRDVEHDQRTEGLDMVLVQYNQDADQVLRQARQDNVGVHDNINNIVERVLV